MRRPADAVALSTPQRPLLRRICAFVEERLADPSLSPSAIAAAHHISLRYLYKLFASEQKTVAGWVRARRLERCRRDLADPTLRLQPVGAIAARWGFTDPSSFSRAFREVYGLPPSEYRRLCSECPDQCTPAGGDARGTARRDSHLLLPKISCCTMRHMSPVWTSVTVDCVDPARLAAFWGALLGREESPALPGWRQLGRQGDAVPRINFQPVPEPKHGKVRVQLDLTVDDIDDGVRRVIDLGGCSLDERREYDEGVVVVMADPEGNEFCLLQYHYPQEDPGRSTRAIVHARPKNGALEA